MSRSKYRFSLDEITARLDSPEDSALLSDGSRGMSAIVANADMPPPVDLDADELRRYNSAWVKIKREAKHLLTVFRLIVKHNKDNPDRKAYRSSVWQMIPFKRQLALLARIFKGMDGKPLPCGAIPHFCEKSPGKWSVRFSNPANGKALTRSTDVTVGSFFACSDA